MKIFANRMVNVKNADNRVRGRTGCITLLMEFDAGADSGRNLAITNLAVHPIAGGVSRANRQNITDFNAERAPLDRVAGASFRSTDYPANFDCLLSMIDDHRTVGNKGQLDTEWFRRCCVGKDAQTFFSIVGMSDINRRAACRVAADAYLFLEAGGPPEIISRQKIEKIQTAGRSLRAALPRPQYLPAEAADVGFLSILDNFCKWNGPATAVRTSKGNSVRSAFISELAKGLEVAFRNQHVAYMHYLVTLGWPDTCESVTRRRRDETREAIEKQAAEDWATNQKVERDAILAVGVATAAASRSSRSVSKQNQMIIDQLQMQIDRLRSGRTRFLSDVDLIRSLTKDSLEFQELGLAEIVSTYLNATAGEYGLNGLNE